MVLDWVQLVFSCVIISLLPKIYYFKYISINWVPSAVSQSIGALNSVAMLASRRKVVYYFLGS